MGRPLTETAPDGAVTTYSYYQNTTTITDPAGKWKKYVYDAFDQLTQVEEPPATGGGSNVTTNYGYNVLGQFVSVSMTRNGTTQTRSFSYAIPATGVLSANLQSETHPETGITR